MDITRKQDKELERAIDFFTFNIKEGIYDEDILQGMDRDEIIDLFDQEDRIADARMDEETEK